MNKIRNEIISLIREIAIIDNDLLLNDDTNLIYDLGLSSIELLTFITKLEDNLELSIPDDDYTLDNFEKLGEVVLFLNNLLQDKKNDRHI